MTRAAFLVPPVTRFMKILAALCANDCQAHDEFAGLPPAAYSRATPYLVSVFSYPGGLERFKFGTRQLQRQAGDSRVRNDGNTVRPKNALRFEHEGREVEEFQAYRCATIQPALPAGLSPLSPLAAVAEFRRRVAAGKPEEECKEPLGCVDSTACAYQAPGGRLIVIVFRRDVDPLTVVDDKALMASLGLSDASRDTLRGVAQAVHEQIEEAVAEELASSAAPAPAAPPVAATPRRQQRKRGRASIARATSSDGEDVDSEEYVGSEDDYYVARKRACCARVRVRAPAQRNSTPARPSRRAPAAAAATPATTSTASAASASSSPLSAAAAPAPRAIPAAPATAGIWSATETSSAAPLSWQTPRSPAPSADISSTTSPRTGSYFEASPRPVVRIAAAPTAAVAASSKVADLDNAAAAAAAAAATAQSYPAVLKARASEAADECMQRMLWLEMSVVDEAEDRLPPSSHFHLEDSDLDQWFPRS